MNSDEEKYMREKAAREIAEQRLAQAISALKRAEEILANIFSVDELRSPAWLRETIEELEKR